MSGAGETVVGKEPLDLERQFPEILKITDDALRAMVIEIWEELWAESEWLTLESVRVSPEIDYPHLPHNRSVVLMALAVADTFEAMHGITIDRNQLVAAAILQDASKLVETRPAADGTAELTERGRYFPHAFWGTHVALNHGIPHDIAEVMLNHTPQSAVFPASLIGKILYYVDQMDVIGIYKDRFRKHLVITK
jgi:hypothetical protein